MLDLLDINYAVSKDPVFKPPPSQKKLSTSRSEQSEPAVSSNADTSTFSPIELPPKKLIISPPQILIQPTRRYNTGSRKTRSRHADALKSSETDNEITADTDGDMETTPALPASTSSISACKGVLHHVTTDSDECRNAKLSRFPRSRSDGEECLHDAQKHVPAIKRKMVSNVKTDKCKRECKTRVHDSFSPNRFIVLETTYEDESLWGEPMVCYTLKPL
jgi:hypothetical protein